MEIIDNLSDHPKDKIVHILIGDGSTEVNFLPSILSHYNRDDIKFYYPILDRPNPGTGFGALKIFPHLIIEHPNHFFFVTDYEMLENDNLPQTVHKAITKFGEITDEELLSDRAGIFTCQIRNRSTILYVAITGREKMIEEELAEFIRLSKGIEVAPTKEISKDLRQHGIKKKDVKELLKNSSKKNIQDSFCSMHLILSEIETNGLRN